MAKKLHSSESYAEITKNTNELRDKCKLYLAYLMEQGYRLEVRYNRDHFYEVFFIGKQNLSLTTTREPFEWGDIKLDFIQFISAINNEYSIAGGDISFYGNPHRNILVQRVLDDMIINNLKIETIQFLICIE